MLVNRASQIPAKGHLTNQAYQFWTAHVIMIRLYSAMLFKISG